MYAALSSSEPSNASPSLIGLVIRSSRRGSASRNGGNNLASSQRRITGTVSATTSNNTTPPMTTNAQLGIGTLCRDDAPVAAANAINNTKYAAEFTTWHTATLVVAAEVVRPALRR